MASESSPPSFSPSLSPPLSTSVSPSSSPSPSSLPPPSALPAQPPVINYVLGFLLVGLAWGFTTPFLRRAARDHHPPPHPLLQREAIRTSAVRRRLYGAFFSVLDLLRNPRYAAPLLINLTGSVWFFLLIGQAGAYLLLLASLPPPLSLSLPIPRCQM